MKYTKKQGVEYTWHTYHGGFEYCYMRFRKSLKVQILRDREFLYDSYTHSSGLLFNRIEDAKAFIEKLVAGSYNWKKDVEKHHLTQADKETEYQAYTKQMADDFLSSLQRHKISVTDFLKLNETFDKMNGKSRSIIYQTEDGVHESE